MFNFLREPEREFTMQYQSKGHMRFLIGFVFAMLIAIACTGFASNVSKVNRANQGKALGSEISKLLDLKLDLAADAVLRASAIGSLMELNAKVEHLADLEELMLAAEPPLLNQLKGKLDKIRRYDMGYGCSISANNLEAYALTTRNVELAAELKLAQELIVGICATAKEP